MNGGARGIRSNAWCGFLTGPPVAGMSERVWERAVKNIGASNAMEDTADADGRGGGFEPAHDETKRLVSSRIRSVLMGGVAAVSALLLALGYVSSGRYTCSKLILIDAPPTSVYSSVADLSQWPAWSVLAAPDVRVVARGTGAGATLGWTGDHPVFGDGVLRILWTDPQRGIEFEVRIGDRPPAIGRILIEPDGEQTWVRCEVDYSPGWNPRTRFWRLFLPELLEPEIERSLCGLGTHLEQKKPR